MTPLRPAQAGVTLIEMLVALTISSLIGLAGFILLDSVTRSEAGLAGRLQRIDLQSRAFALMARDVEGAHSAMLTDTLVLTSGKRVVTWRTHETGLIRSIAAPDRVVLDQRILDEPATFSMQQAGLVVLTLTDADIWWHLPLPRGPAR
ncbi:prepilin-type N-terminal cleavage/methylation domain-containing protein [uncultured Tateyamaria sp.]|uniref:PulJ/GspJ family protein n=1 Tax=Tateyamaria sp. 1078 TaxID=3417464 RepID=UPI0026305C39|nr:prepilin-type N-terminal cleavage/methylation domain-containing protein [uncultured Tateyamaria sp.]